MKNKNNKGGFFIFTRIFIPLFFVLAGGFIFNCSAWAADISTDVTWTKAQSPIIIKERVWVMPSATLTIEPGVVIKLYPNQFITTSGVFKAIGTNSEPVVFTSIRDDEYGGDTNGDGAASHPQPGDWWSLFFHNGATSTMQNVIIKYGGVYRYPGVSYYEGAINTFKSSVNITNSIITNNAGGIRNSQGPLTITNSSIYNNPQPFWKGELFDVAIGNNAGSSSSTVSAVNNWWGTSEGPCVFRDFMPPGVPPPKDLDLRAVCGNRPLIDWGVSYAPWLTAEPSQKQSNPVIIVPGILGSFLNKNEPGLPEVWPNAAKMALPGDDDYLNELALTATGWPDFSDNLIATDAIRKILTSDFWDGLITELENNNYNEGENLFVFPYDWRLDINWLAGESPLPNHQGLKEKIEEVKGLTGADKVDIIAHSLGGLVTKKYLQKYGNSSVDKFIDIATPHLGAPKAFKALMYGDDFGFSAFGLGLNQDTVKYISQNMPAVYELLPSREYFNISDFNISDPDYENYIGDIYDFDGNNIKGNLDYGETAEFMKNTGRNSSLLTLSDNFHQEIDNLAVPNTFNIVGCGEPTIGKIYVLNKGKSGGYEYGLKYINGDATVPLRSAEAISSSKIYIKGSKHANIPSADGAKQLVTSILKGEQADFNFSPYPDLSLDKGICSFSGTQVSYHSPIELHIYDENNNHLGPDENGDIEMGIGGASYDEIERNKFAFLPAGHNYRVIGKATEAGTFNARIQDIENGNYKGTVYYNEVPLPNASSTIQFNVSAGQNNYSMSVDNDGDGSFEGEILPSSILSEEEAGDLIKPETSINIIGVKGNDDWYVSDWRIELIGQDNEGGSGILKTDYSLDNGGSWKNYAGSFSLSQEGETNILYFSTDRAGNMEEAKGAALKIDKTGPVLDSLIPYEGEEFLRSESFYFEYLAEDGISGIATNTEEVFLDGVKINPSETIDLFNLSLGEHIFKISLADMAGNISALEIKFRVIASIESAISDIARSFNAGLIFDEKIKDKLTERLIWIKDYIEKVGEKEEKREEKYGERMSKCLEKKEADWCEEKIGGLAAKIIYKLEEVYKKVVLDKYEIILKELESYYKKDWISEEGYDIIKEDINYLINNL